MKQQASGTSKGGKSAGTKKLLTDKQVIAKNNYKKAVRASGAKRGK